MDTIYSVDAARLPVFGLSTTIFNFLFTAGFLEAGSVHAITLYTVVKKASPPNHHFKPSLLETWEASKSMVASGATPSSQTAS